MLNDEERLKAEVGAAWEAQQRHQYEVIEPRFYKEKRGRKMEVINPWKSLKERDTVEQEGHRLYWEYHRLYIEYYKETGKTIDVNLLYRRVETPSGDRWVRKDGESSAA